MGFVVMGRVAMIDPTVRDGEPGVVMRRIVFDGWGWLAELGLEDPL